MIEIRRKSIAQQGWRTLFAPNNLVCMRNALSSKLELMLNLFEIKSYKRCM